MEAVQADAPTAGERRAFTGWELAAAAALAATVVLHVVAMVFDYFSGPLGQGSLASQTDQAALYAALAASWALALGVFVSGSGRRWLGAGLAAGIAATELGFRLSDLGYVIRYGSSAAGTGVWLMTGAWVLGAAGAVLAVVAAWRRSSVPAVEGELAADVSPEPALPLVAGPVPPPAPVPAASAWARPDTDLTQEEPQAERAETRHPVLAVLAVAVLALATAGFYLPAWDHYVAVSSATGGRISFNAGNAWDYPWQVILGNFVVAFVVVALPVAAITFRRKDFGTGVIVGAVLVMATQFISAVVQVSEPVSPSLLGLTPSRASQLGLSIGGVLTGWFTLDVLAAFALFALVVVLYNVKPAFLGSSYRNSPGTLPSAPAAPSEATLPSS